MKLLANTIYLAYHVYTLGYYIIHITSEKNDFNIAFILNLLFECLILFMLLYYIKRNIFSKNKLNPKELILIVVSEIIIEFTLIIFIFSTFSNWTGMGGGP